MKRLILALMMAACLKPGFAADKAMIPIVEVSNVGEPVDVRVPVVEAPNVLQPKAMVSFVETSGVTQPKGKRLWQFSLAALAVGNVMDAQSSWGKRELNQNLAGSNGSFGLHSALIKVGIAAGVCTVEYLVLRRRPSAGLYRKLAFINFGDASVTGAMAIRNYGVPRY
jgi:hypothetical protein